MWIVKPFIQKEPAGLAGKIIEVGTVKVHIRNAIAEGGFSCVYLARDAVNPSNQYALKHMICQDGESLELAMKEISVMKQLKGHPNVVTLIAHAVFDMGRTKEVLLVMEFCEKSLVTALENRGAGYFEEKQILLIFRDVCNAVFAMHCQSPPIAHRDLKAENVLFGADGSWKLCDFGSTSTNHKRFDKPEEMGIEEDNIRKHTTPAYRAPEMWDLYRKEIISEKADIWALGCLLYRICYFRSAFDGESKLQILNGNYRIPDQPKYSNSVTGLIKDMLEASPRDRPDITQVWFRVNELLPVELQKHLPNGTGSAPGVMHTPAPDVQDEGLPKRSPVMPRRSPPPPPQSEKAAIGTPMGAFWSTQHAQDSNITEKGPVFDEEPTNQLPSKQNHEIPETKSAPPIENQIQRSTPRNSKRFDDSSTGDFEIRFAASNSKTSSEKKPVFQNEAFNSFVADFDAGKLKNKPETEELEAEIDRLKEQLKQENLEKAEMTSKYEKLSAICRSQRQEIQELKRALAAAAVPSPPSKDSSKSQISSSKSSSSETPPREKIEGTVWELQQGMFESSPATPSSDQNPWQAFSDEPKALPASRIGHPKSVRTINSQRIATESTPSCINDSWGFGEDGFTADSGGPRISRTSDRGPGSQRFGAGDIKKVEAKHPAGWAGF